MGKEGGEGREVGGKGEGVGGWEERWKEDFTFLHLVVGHFVEQRASLGVPLMQEWIDDDHMWLRRTAILHQVSTGGRKPLLGVVTECGDAPP